MNKVKLIVFFLCCSHLSAFSLDEKIGQLFIAPVYPKDENALKEKQPVPNRDYIDRLITKYHIGGVLLKFYWDLEEEKEAIEHFQSLSKTPLFICQDVERGLSQRVRDIGPAAKTDGYEIGRQCRLAGVNFALAPVADVDSNPENPVIGKRSFGSDADEVATVVSRVVCEIQSCGVIATAKHFPGHGDTSEDSHAVLPILKHNRERINSVELKPFKAAIEGGVMAVMTGHLAVLAFDDKPASLSRHVVEELLRKDLGFEGLVITDDLLMGAVRSDEAALEAFKAGNDLILSAPDIPRAIEQIKAVILSGEIAEEELDERVERIQKAKRFCNKKTGLQLPRF